LDVNLIQLLKPYSVAMDQISDFRSWFPSRFYLCDCDFLLKDLSVFVRLRACRYQFFSFGRSELFLHALRSFPTAESHPGFLSLQGFGFVVGVPVAAWRILRSPFHFTADFVFSSGSGSGAGLSRLGSFILLPPEAVLVFLRLILAFAGRIWVPPFEFLLRGFVFATMFISSRASFLQSRESSLAPVPFSPSAQPDLGPCFWGLLLVDRRPGRLLPRALAHRLDSVPALEFAIRAKEVFCRPRLGFIAVFDPVFVTGGISVSCFPQTDSFATLGLFPFWPPLVQSAGFISSAVKSFTAWMPLAGIQRPSRQLLSSKAATQRFPQILQAHQNGHAGRQDGKSYRFRAGAALHAAAGAASQQQLPVANSAPQLHAFAAPPVVSVPPPIDEYAGAGVRADADFFGDAGGDASGVAPVAVTP
jgi:hypothetical protein